MQPVDRRAGQLTDEFVAADLEQMRSAVNYNRWLFSLLRPHLGRRIFEVGAGIGNLTTQFLDVADFVFAIEPNRSCVNALADFIGERKDFEYRPWRLEDCAPADLRSFHFDTVVCVNVLEHLADDGMAARLMQAAVPPGGRVVIMVPAVAWAYGTIDKAVGHFRRYSKNSLRQVLEQADLQVDFLRYSNFIGLIGWLYNARVNKKVRQSDQQIQLFEKLVPWIARTEKILPPMVGMSLLAVAHRIDSQ